MTATSVQQRKSRVQAFGCSAILAAVALSAVNIAQADLGAVQPVHETFSRHRRECSDNGCSGTCSGPLCCPSGYACPCCTAENARIGITHGRQVSTHIRLNNGQEFPRASYGLQVYPDQIATQRTLMALDAGFRNFFTSVLAGNQPGFGEAMRQTTVPRHELYIMGSVNSGSCSTYDQCFAQTTAGCATNMRDLGFHYLDSIMLDYPSHSCDGILGQWDAFENMLRAGHTHALAVSNFNSTELDCILRNSSLTVPTVNQLHFSAAMTNPDPTPYAMITSNRDRLIVAQSYSPLNSGRLVHNAIAIEIGAAHNKTAVQVALRWIIEMGGTFTTQTSSLQHAREDLEIFDFELTDIEMLRLGGVVPDFITVAPTSGSTPPPDSGNTSPPTSGSTPPPDSGNTSPPTSGSTPPPASMDPELGSMIFNATQRFPYDGQLAYVRYGERTQWAIGTYYRIAPVSLTECRFADGRLMFGNCSAATFMLRPMPPGFVINAATGEVVGSPGHNYSMNCLLIAELDSYTGVVANITFTAVPPDSVNPTNGPNGRGCGNNGEIEDNADRTDGAFACHCVGGFTGPNCEERANNSSDKGKDTDTEKSDEGGRFSSTDIIIAAVGGCVASSLAIFAIQRALPRRGQTNVDATYQTLQMDDDTHGKFEAEFDDYDDPLFAL